MYETFIDLDELVLLCRTKYSKKFIKEAIDCYRAGAFRSCIVSTWNAVVFDFIHKLRELQLVGDKQAEEQLEKFEKLRSVKDYRGLWDFEASISKIALEKFELISHIEESDIQRLFEDRSRCAHPSMTSLEEPFEATAELARYHLRSAITHLLQRPPVQGRAARERIFEDIKSEYFPIDVDSAVKHFEKSPLCRARSILVQDIVIGLTVSLLTKDYQEEEKKRQFSALNAVSIMYPKDTQNILNDRLSDIILTKVKDVNLEKVIYYLANINAWDNIDEPCQIKLNNFITKLEFSNGDPEYYEEFTRQSINIIVKAIHINFLKQSVISKFQLPFRDLLSLKRLCNDRLIDESLKPLLVNQLSEATLHELISIRAEEDTFDKEYIQFYLVKAIENNSLRELFSLVSSSKIALEDLVKSGVKERIRTEDLNGILRIRLLISDPDLEFDSNKEALCYAEIVEETNIILLILLQKLSLDELLPLKQKYSYDDLLCDFIQEEVSKDIDAVVDQIELSNTYDRAETNSRVLFDIFDLLTESHWHRLLNAFSDNNQIHGSRNCPEIFCDLFNKCTTIKARNSLQYWSIFRDKLNHIRNPRVAKLEKAIDLYFSLEI